MHTQVVSGVERTEALKSVTHTHTQTHVAYGNEHTQQDNLLLGSTKLLSKWMQCVKCVCQVCQCVCG